MSLTTVMICTGVLDLRGPAPKYLYFVVPLVPFAAYLLGLGKLDPYERRERGRYTIRQGYSIQDFRDHELQRSKQYLDPLHRFMGRRNLEKVCEMLSVEQNLRRKMRGEAELPVYQPVLEPWSQILARLGPKGPSHLYTMIRE